VPGVDDVALQRQQRRRPGTFGVIDGRSGLRDLLGHIVLWRVGARWLCVILLATLVLPGAYGA
jgi:hypothetical protein